MPYANHDQCHGYNGTVFTKDVDKDLEYGLVVGGTDCSVKVLNGEEEAKKVEPAKDKGDGYGEDYANGGAACCVACFFAEVGAGVEAGDCIPMQFERFRCCGPQTLTELEECRRWRRMPGLRARSSQVLRRRQLSR
jgi:hypothetical protein